MITNTTHTAQQPDYSYQSGLIAECWGHLQAEGRVVLAAGCGAGKTGMAINVIGKYLDANPQTKVLVLAHGQRELRGQFYEALRESGVSFSFTQVGTKDEDLNTQVHVALPHASARLAESTYGLIVVDEAHQFFFGRMVQGIVKANPKAKLMLLTASHGRFNSKDAPWGPVVCLSILELMDRGVIMDTRVEIVKAAEDFRINQDGNLEQSYKFANLNQSLRDALQPLKERLQRPGSKHLIACHNTATAKRVAAHLSKHEGIRATVTTADADPNSWEIREFRSKADVRVLVVVYRGILGFNLPELESVIDFTASQNVDRLYQLLGRIIRFHPGKEPLYVKLVPEANEAWYRYVMSAVMHLVHPDVYRDYDGTIGALRMVIPRANIPTKEVVSSGGRQWRAKPVLIPPTFSEVADLFRKVGSGDYCVTTLREVRDRINGQDSKGKKLQLLEAIKAGASRPSTKTELGRVLMAYTSPSHPCFDQEFRDTIYKIDAEINGFDGWFEVVIRKKNALRQALLAAKPRPVKCSLGIALQNYTCKTRNYDAEFHQEMLKLDADVFPTEHGWFGWTESKIFTSTQACESMKEWKQRKPRAWAAAQSRGLLQKVYAATGWKRIYAQRRILCHQTGRTYTNLSAASESLGLSKTKICGVLNGRRPHAGGFTFEYVVEEET